MEYTIIVDGRSYDLPKKNIVIMDQLDEALKIDSKTNFSARQKYERLHTIVKEILGEENAKEILGSDNLNEIDLSELSLAILKINDAYDKPLADYRTEKMRESLSSIPTEKIVSLTKSIKDLEETQKQIQELTISVKELALSVKNMVTEQKSQGERIKILEDEPGKSWKTAKATAMTTIIGTVAGALAMGLVFLIANYL